MSNGIVLNHHSLPFDNIVDANNGLLLFFHILKVCRSAGLKILLVDDDQDKTLMRLELSKGYFVSNWFSNANNNPLMKDWCGFLRLLETKQPIFEKVDIEAVCDNIEVGLLGEKSGKQVLLAAFYLKTFLTSFSTLEHWLEAHIRVWVLDVSKEIENKEDSLLNLFDKNSLEVHKDELLRRRNELISSAKDIWVNRRELFPSITLQPNQIGTSLQNWSARMDVLLKARNALNVLEEFCSKWKIGIYADYRHKHLIELGLAAEISGESTSVSNNPNKKRERMFWLDDGREVYCENHVKLPDGYRLHFYPDADKKHIFVTYLGPHLVL